MNTEARNIISFFGTSHLPAGLQAVVEPFRELVVQTVLMVGESYERDEALRKLLEAKDCAVRAYLLTNEEDREQLLATYRQIMAAKITKADSGSTETKGL